MRNKARQILALDGLAVLAPESLFRAPVPAGEALVVSESNLTK